MPPWVPEAVWKNEDVFIIGGGTSLKDFNWSLLENEWTIGCNSAFTLGEKVCKICVFGDARWFEIFAHELKAFKGTVFTNSPQLYKNRLPWLWTMLRESRGLHHHALGWNKNTGATAINLALLLGASRIYLLGFDMALSLDGKPNWHDRQILKPDASIYPKFASNITKYVTRDLLIKWPNVEVWNVTDASTLEPFPKVSVAEFWSKRSSV